MYNLNLLAMNQLEFWFLTGVMAALGTIVWYSVRKVVDSLERVRENLTKLDITLTLHTEQIKNLGVSYTEHKEDFKRLSDRVDHIARIQDRCNACREVV